MESLAGRRQARASATPNKQAAIELIFEDSYPGAHGGLGNVQFVCRSHEAAGRRHLKECSCKADIHPRALLASPSARNSDF